MGIFQVNTARYETISSTKSVARESLQKTKVISPARSHPSPSEEVAKLNSDIKLFEVKKKKYREACI